MSKGYMAVMYRWKGTGPLLAVIPAMTVPGEVVEWLGRIHDDRPGIVIRVKDQYIDEDGIHRPVVQILDWAQVPA